MQVLQTGPISTWRKHHTTGEITQVELSYEILEQERKDTWIIFQLIGGPTGFESFILSDGQQIRRTDPEWTGPYWLARRGCPEVWNEVRVHRDEMTRVLTEYFEGVGRES